MQTNIVNAISNKLELILSAGFDDKSFGENPIFIDNTFETIDEIPNFKGNLYHHQRAVVAAMIRLETTRRVKVTGGYDLNYDAALLRDPVGTGKTIELISLMLLNKKQRLIPNIMHFTKSISYKNAAEITEDYDLKKCLDDKTTADVILHQRHHTILKPTLIVVGLSVFKQWLASIKRFSNLSVYEVTDAARIRKLVSVIKDKTINEYDVVLVRTSKCTEASKGWPVDDPNFPTPSDGTYTVDIINSFNVCWNRVIIDDYDVIKLSTDLTVLRGVFTWYISATNKEAYKKPSAPTEILPVEQVIETQKSQLAFRKNIVNPMSAGLLSIQCDPEFIQNSIKFLNCHYRVVNIDASDKVYYKNLEHLCDNKALIEMINANAYASIGRELKKAYKSVGDIFSALLDNKYKEYDQAIEMCAYLDREIMSERPPPPKGNHRVYTEKDLEKMQAIKFEYLGLKELMHSSKAEWEKKKQQIIHTITRIKNNLSEGSCPICLETFPEGGKYILIVKCCNATYCSECAVQALKLKTDRSSCALCRSPITPDKIVLIGNHIKLDDIIKQDVQDVIVKRGECGEVKVEAKGEGEEEEQVCKSKIAAVKNIILYKPILFEDLDGGLFPDIIRNVNLDIQDNSPRKVLIFSNYDDTFDETIAFLVEKGIKYNFLKGLGITEIGKEFQDSAESRVLFINSKFKCAGINLQTATDIIFYHAMYDRNTVVQCIGRGQRIGRTNSLNIWFICNAGEDINEYISGDLSNVSDAVYSKIKKNDHEQVVRV